jgi:CRP-like cAMP-binding protein
MKPGFDQNDRAEVLARLGRHKALSALDGAALEALLGYAHPLVLRPRTRLFSAGDEGSALFLVLSGWIKLSRTGRNGRDIVLELAGPGSLFGELGVLCRQPRAADATAISTCRVLAIDGRAVIAALKSNPDALLEVVHILGTRLANTTAQLEDGISLSAEARLARTLLRLAALEVRPGRSGLLIDLGLSQSDLGELTGLSRESINKLLSAWRDQGWVALAGRRLTLIDLPALQEVAEPT